MPCIILLLFVKIIILQLEDCLFYCPSETLVQEDSHGFGNFEQLQSYPTRSGFELISNQKRCSFGYYRYT